MAIFFSSSFNLPISSFYLTGKDLIDDKLELTILGFGVDYPGYSSVTSYILDGGTYFLLSHFNEDYCVIDYFYVRSSI